MSRGDSGDNSNFTGALFPSSYSPMPTGTPLSSSVSSSRSKGVDSHPRNGSFFGTPPQETEMGPLLGSDRSPRSNPRSHSTHAHHRHSSVSLRRGIPIPSDLETFFRRIYEYYLVGGFWALVVKEVFELLALGFSIVFSTFVFILVDWPALWRCHSSDCFHNTQKIRAHPFTDMDTTRFVILIFELFFSFYWVTVLFLSIRKIFASVELKHLYESEDGLNIKRNLDSYGWDRILEKLIRWANKSKISRSKDALHEVDIVSQIMRRENFVIGLYNRQVIDFSFPFPEFLTSRFSFLQNVLTTRGMCSPITDWAISLTFPMFEKRDKLGIRSRFIMLGIGSLFLMPFFLVYTVLSFVFRFAEAFKKNPSSMGSRTWTHYARQVFRDFNELPHAFESRMARASKIASKYLDEFDDTILSIICSNLALILGAIFVTFLLISIANPPMIVNLEFFGITLGTYMFIFGPISAGIRVFIADRFRDRRPAQHLDQLMNSLHLRPTKWEIELKKNPRNPTVYAEISSLYRYRILAFLYEVIAVICAPVILCFRLPQCADGIVDFFSKFSDDANSVRPFCTFATFDMRKHGNSEFGSKFESDRLMTSKDGKLEYSIINFRNMYQGWIPELNLGVAEFHGVLADHAEEQALELSMRNRLPLAGPITAAVGRGQQSHEATLATSPLLDGQQEMSSSVASMLGSSGTNDTEMLTHPLHATLYGPGLPDFRLDESINPLTKSILEARSAALDSRRVAEEIKSSSAKIELLDDGDDKSYSSSEDYDEENAIPPGGERLDVPRISDDHYANFRHRTHVDPVLQERLRLQQQDDAMNSSLLLSLGRYRRTNASSSLVQRSGSMSEAEDEDGGSADILRRY